MLDCYETVKLFQENNVDLPDKAFDMVVSALISNDHMKEALELLFSQIKGEKVVNMNLREHIKLLLLRGEVENVFAVLEKYPITVKHLNIIEYSPECSLSARCTFGKTLLNTPAQTTRRTGFESFYRSTRKLPSQLT